MKTGFVIMEKEFAYDDNFYFDEGHAFPYRIIFNLEEAKETKNKLELVQFKELLLLTEAENLYNSLFDYQMEEPWAEDDRHNDFCQKFFNLNMNTLMKTLETEIRKLQEYRRFSFRKTGSTDHTRGTTPDTPIIQKMKSLSDQDLLEFQSFFKDIEFYTIAEVEIQHVLA